MKVEYPRFLSYKISMNYIGIGSYNTLHKMIDQGLPVIVIDGVKKIDRLEIDKFLKSRTV